MNEDALNFNYADGKIYSAKLAFELILGMLIEGSIDYFNVATYTVNCSWTEWSRPRRMIIGNEKSISWPNTEVKVLPRNHVKLYLAYKNADKMPVTGFFGSANFVGPNQLYDILYHVTTHKELKSFHKLYEMLWAKAQQPIVIHAPNLIGAKKHYERNSHS